MILLTKNLPKEELTVDLKDGSRLNIDLIVSCGLKMGKIETTTFSLSSANTMEVVNLFDLSYFDQIFVMKEIAKLVRHLGQELAAEAFSNEVEQTLMARGSRIY